jgi:signal transduction histidine kinase
VRVVVGRAYGVLGRDAYRIVQEALTNIGEHAGGVNIDWEGSHRFR